MMIFIHYAMQHPLYTYAIFSPKSKRVIYRQDVIFLTNVFPMREARAMGGLEPDGEKLVAYTSPNGLRMNQDPELSFDDWKENDEIPLYEDHVNGFDLEAPPDYEINEIPIKEANRTDGELFQPNHPDFGGKSSVKVFVPEEILSKTLSTEIETNDADELDIDHKVSPPVIKKPTRRPVNQRWYYEPVVDKEQSETSGLESIGEPDHLGTLQEIAHQDIDNINNDESGACYLHGTVS
jgi:hypothetical protein